MKAYGIKYKSLHIHCPVGGLTENHLLKSCESAKNGATTTAAAESSTCTEVAALHDSTLQIDLRKSLTHLDLFGSIHILLQNSIDQTGGLCRAHLVALLHVILIAWVSTNTQKGHKRSSSIPRPTMSHVCMFDRRLLHWLHLHVLHLLQAAGALQVIVHHKNSLAALF